MSINRNVHDFTVVTPSTDSRVIYVSSSQGSDDNNGLSPDDALNTVADGVTKLRNGYPDHLLLKRGDSWNESISNFKLSGRGTDEPIVFGAYGEGSRPILKTADNNGITIGSIPESVSHVYILGLAVYANTRDPNSIDFNEAHKTVSDNIGIHINAPGDNILIEDCHISFYINNLSIQSYGNPVSNCTVRRNIIVDSYAISNVSSGVHIRDGQHIIIEYNIVDHNGYNEFIAEARPTILGSNILVDASISDLQISNNIVTRAANTGILLKSGAVVANNIVARNATGISASDINTDGTIEILGNAILDGKDINSSTLRGIGINVADSPQAVIRDNIIAHTALSTGVAINIDDVVDVVIDSNVCYQWDGNIIFNGSIENLVFSSNIIQSTDISRPLIEFTDTTIIRDYTWNSNRYHSTRRSDLWFSNGGTTYNIDGWLTATGGTGDSDQVQLPESTRLLTNYNQSVGNISGFDQFVELVRGQSIGNFDTDYDISTILNWIRLGYIAGGIRIDEFGFTRIDPTADAHVIHVDSVEGGDDNDGSEGTPVKSIVAGMALMRDGFPDQLLLRCGRIYNETFGTWVLSGQSADRPLLIGCYGSGARPVVKSNSSNIIEVNSEVSNIAIIGIDFYCDERDPESPEFIEPSIAPVLGINWTGDGSNVLIEDCKFRLFVTGIHIDSSQLNNITIRRNIIADSYGWNHKFKSAGADIGGVSGLIIEQNIFDHNGWHETISSNQKVIDFFGSSGEIAEIGRRTDQNHNLIIHNNCDVVSCIDNISSRASSTGIVIYSGGDVSNNFITRCPVGISLGGNADSSIADIVVSVNSNIISEGLDIGPNALRGDGIIIRRVSAASITNNIIARYIGLATGRIAITQSQSATYSDNIIYQWNQSEDTPTILSDPTRTLSTYAGSIGDDVHIPSILNSITARERGVWLDEYDAPSISQYIESGFTSIAPGVSIDDNGFTKIVPSLESRKVYISLDGNDTNDGITATTPVKTIAKAKLLMNDGSSDQLLFNSGEIWNEAIGSWELSGESPQLPILISRYGSGSRPQFRCTDHGLLLDNITNVSVIGLDFYANKRDPSALDYIEWSEDSDAAYRYDGIHITDSSDILIEDCRIRFFACNVRAETGDPSSIKIIRNIITDAWDVTEFNITNISFGIKISNVSDLIIRNNYLDHNGWNQETIFGDRISVNGNIFIDITGQHAHDIQDNHVMRGGHYGLQTNGACAIERNAFIENAIAVAMLSESANPSSFSGNVVLDAVDSNLPSGQGCKFATNGDLTVSDNIIFNNKTSVRSANPYAYLFLSANKLSITSNIVYEFEGGVKFSNFSNFETIAFNNVDIQNDVLSRPLITMRNIDGDHVISGNRYHSVNPDAFEIDGNLRDYNQYAALVDEANGAFIDVAYFDHNRNTGTFVGFIDKANIQEFEVIQSSRAPGRWDIINKVINLIDHIREGFSLTALGSGDGQDNEAPTTTLLANPLIRRSNYYEFQIAFADRVDIDGNSLSNGIVVIGPDGTQYTPQLVCKTADRAHNIICVYRIESLFGVKFNDNNNGIYTVNVLGDKIKDDLGNYIAAQSIGTFNINIATNSPIAVVTVNPIIVANNNEQQFVVTYTSASIKYHIDAQSVTSNNIVVTGPNGYRADARLIDISPSTDNILITATYSIAPPGGMWNDLSNGFYEIALNDDQIRDTSGTAANGRSLGLFSVSITDGPGATVKSPVVVAKGDFHRFEVIYYSDVDIDLDTLSNGDIRVSGPNGYLQSAKLITIDDSNKTAVGVIYEITPPRDRWDILDNGYYAVSTQADQVMAVDGKSIRAGIIGKMLVAVQTLQPTANVHTRDIIVGDQSLYEFSVVYRAGEPGATIKIGSISNNNIIVDGIDGFRTSAQLIGVDSNSDLSVIARYRIRPPTDLWDHTTNGRYDIRLISAISDSNKLGIKTGVLGSFTVHISEPESNTIATSNITNYMHLGGLLRFYVSYGSSVPIDINTIGNDINITGPNGYNRIAKLISTEGSGNTATVIYEVTPLQKVWSSTDNGSYNVIINEASISDIAGRHIKSRKIGKLEVDVDGAVDGGSLSLCNLSLNQLSLSLADYYRLQLCNETTELVLIREQHPHRFVELFGGRIVQYLWYAPDPVTFRDQYYYNTRLNALYQRIILDERPGDGIVRAIWKEATYYEEQHRIKETTSTDIIEQPISERYRQLIRCGDDIYVPLSILDSEAIDSQVILYNGIAYEHDNGQSDPTIPIYIGNLLHKSEYVWISSCNSRLATYQQLQRCADDIPVGLSIRRTDISGDTILYGGICYTLISTVSYFPIGRSLGRDDIEFIDDCLDSRCIYKQLVPCLSEGSVGEPVDLFMRVSDISDVALRYRGVDYSFDDQIFLEPEGPLVYQGDVIWFDECPQNNPPIVTGFIEDQNITAYMPFTLVMPDNLFTDPDIVSPYESDTLTISVDAGSNNWIEFDETSLTISGTPDDSDVGDYVIVVTAIDSGGLSAAVTFNINVAANQIPVGQNIDNQQAVEDKFFAFQVPIQTFTTDDILIYSTKLLNGNNLPTWLHFDATSRLFTGVPSNSDVGQLNIRVTVVDTALQSASQVFSLKIINSADAPEIGTGGPVPIDDQQAIENSLFSIIIPSDTFIDPDIEIGATDELSYLATLSDGLQLPEWLNFDNETKSFSGTPLTNDIGAIAVRIIVSDSTGLSVSTEFNINVVEENRPPQLNNVLPLLTAGEGILFVYTIPADTFIDPNNDDTISYSVTLMDGSAVPSWLILSGRTIRGVPGSTDLGLLDLKIIATDSGGLTADAVLHIDIINTNDPPQVTGDIITQVILEDDLFELEVPSEVFTDPDINDVLTYSATLSSGEPLPSWLLFDKDLPKFSGIPGNLDVGAIVVRLTAVDLGGASAFIDFTIVVANQNDPPVVIGSMPDQTIGQDNQFELTIPDGLFRTVDASATLTISIVQRVNGVDSPLPSWLSFDVNNGVLSGTPSATDIGLVDLKLIATDIGGLSASVTFSIYVADLGELPVVDNIIQNQLVTQGQNLAFQFAANTFSDPDSDIESYSAELIDGSPLPTWMSFNTDTRTFSGVPGPADVETIDIRVYAIDQSNQRASTTFSLTVVNINDPPILVNAISDVQIAEDTLLQYTIPQNSFNDIDGDTLSYIAQLISSTINVVPDGEVVEFIGGDEYPAGTYTISYVNGAYFDGIGWRTSGFKIIYNNGQDELIISGIDTAYPTAQDAIGVMLDNGQINTVFTQDIQGPIKITYDVIGDTADLNVYSIDLGLAPRYKLSHIPQTLPSWINFSPATQVFSGTPRNIDVGTIEIEYTASDDSSSLVSGDITDITSISDRFFIDIINVNDTPFIVNNIPDRVVRAETDIELDIATGIFADPDVLHGIELSYYAALLDGSPLPSWLIVNNQTGIISGFAPFSEAATYTIKVTVTDPGAMSINDSFNLTIDDALPVSHITLPSGVRPLFEAADDNRVDMVYLVGDKNLRPSSGGFYRQFLDEFVARYGVYASRLWSMNPRSQGPYTGYLATPFPALAEFDFAEVVGAPDELSKYMQGQVDKYAFLAEGEVLGADDTVSIINEYLQLINGQFGWATSDTYRYLLNYGTFTTGDGSFDMQVYSGDGDIAGSTLVQSLQIDSTADNLSLQHAELIIPSDLSRQSNNLFFSMAISDVPPTPPFFVTYRRIENLDISTGFSTHALAPFEFNKSMRQQAQGLLAMSDDNLLHFYNRVRSLQGAQKRILFVIQGSYADLTDSSNSAGLNPTASNTKAGYIDNVQTIISRTKQITSSYPDDDIYFLIVPGHQTGNPDDVLMSQFRAGARDIAMDNINTTAIDLSLLMTPDEYDQWRNGNDLLNVTGYQQLTQRIIDSIIGEYDPQGIGADPSEVSGLSLLLEGDRGLNDITYIVDARYRSGTDPTVDAGVYRWDGSQLDSVQNIATTGGTDANHFVIDNEDYLAISNFGDDTTYSWPVKIYKWNGSSFSVIQSITSSGPISALPFEIGGDTYLFVANYRDASSYDVNSTLYKWDGDEFIQHQDIATNGVGRPKFYEFGGSSYLVIPNRLTGQPGNISYSTNVKVMKWNSTTSKFTLHQLLAMSGSIDSALIEIGGAAYLVVPSYKTGDSNFSTSNTESVLWSWNASTQEFALSQEISTVGPRSIDSYIRDDVNYVIVPEEDKITIWKLVLSSAGSYQLELVQTLNIDDPRGIRTLTIGVKQYVVVSEFTTPDGSTAKITMYEVDDDGTLSLTSMPAEVTDGATALTSFRITDESANIKYWQDYGPNNLSFANFSSGTPLSVSGGVQFDGIDDFLSRDTAVLSGSIDRTIFIVSSLKSSNSNSAMFQDGDPSVGQLNGSTIRVEGETDIKISTLGKTIEYDADYVSGEKMIVVGSIDSDTLQNSELRLDGVDINIDQSTGSHNQVDINDSGSFLGVAKDSLSNLSFYDGTIMSIIVFDRILGDYEIKTIEYYLAEKYNISLVD